MLLLSCMPTRSFWVCTCCAYTDVVVVNIVTLIVVANNANNAIALVVGTTHFLSLSLSLLAEEEVIIYTYLFYMKSFQHLLLLFYIYTQF